MKKFLMVLALASVSVAGMAQTGETPEMKYSVATNSFWSNWFISADISASSWYSNEEHIKPSFRGDKNGLFESFRTNLGASVSIGKWFTPGLGLRTKVNGIWGRSVLTDDASKNAMKYWNAQEQVLFNLSNLFCGYNETRVWNIIPYVGAGIMRNCSLNEYAHGYSAGLLNTWKLSKHLALNLDLGFQLFDDDIDHVNGPALTQHDAYAISIPSTDRYFTAEIGLTYNLGKATWSKTPDVDALKALSQSQIDALNAQLADEQAENARLKNLLANQPKAETKTVTVKEVVAAPVSVFFNLGKTQIASRKDLQNVQELANVAKEKGAKILVTGYADSKTGSANLNQRLSEKRAETVKNELMKMGVSESDITTVAAGGVDTLSPISYNRRATVEIK